MTASTSSRLEDGVESHDRMRDAVLLGDGCVPSGCVPLTTVTSASGMFARPSRCFIPKAPAAPMTATRTFSLLM